MWRGRAAFAYSEAGVPASAERNAGHSWFMFFVYILKSKKDSKYYYGSTDNVNRRLLEHNSGKVAATKNRRPFIIHYFEQCETRKEAIRKELFFKKRSGYKYLKENNII